ncbi:cardiolipin synthase [Pseudomaricurvus sp.]|uniref:cardiolipin synthase n=1 Tax=Pseudomaricurvus sp. TaxID=2004510 RepID=UPI003F6D32FD
MDIALLGLLLNMTIVLSLIVRVLTRPHRDPSSRIAWIAVIGALPIFGVIAYFLLGETNIGHRRTARMKAVIRNMPPSKVVSPNSNQNTLFQVPKRFQLLFRLGRSINGFEVTEGNSAQLMTDSNSTIASMVKDIDDASDHVHLLFYIWLPDNNGIAIVEALKRAASRGVNCRVMADDIGSRTMIHSKHWKEMKKTGIHLSRALSVRVPILRSLIVRVDLRNHRKILIIDGKITYCGSQNCADPEFRVKAKYAPWVDVMFRFEGPVVRQNQYLFASDWMSHTKENINSLLSIPMDTPSTGFPAQVLGTGPTVRYSAMPEMFGSLFHAAREELVITTPYYVPNESMQSALCSAAWRGIKTTLILPAKNDSWMVGAASRSYYKDLLQAGVEIFEYEGGLLHTKSVTIDREVTLIGSANMDRRSFELNYENNILFYNPELTEDMRSRQQEYLSKSKQVTLERVDAWSLGTRLWNNTLATLGPVL